MSELMVWLVEALMPVVLIAKEQASMWEEKSDLVLLISSISAYASKLIKNASGQVSDIEE